MRSHELVLAWVERELGAGRLALGGRLPGERALADELNMSRPALREGLRVLEALGVLRSSVGSGPSSGTVIVAEPEVPLRTALRLHLASDHLSAADIVETRVLLETWAASRGAGDQAALQTAQRILDEMDDPGLRPGEFLDRDAAFHVALTASAGNPLISAMMASIRHSISSYTLEIAGDASTWSATARRLQEEHRGILVAVLTGDGVAAAESLRRHIERYYREPGS